MDDRYFDYIENILSCNCDGFFHSVDSLHVLRFVNDVTDYASFAYVASSSSVCMPDSLILNIIKISADLDVSVLDVMSYASDFVCLAACSDFLSDCACKFRELQQRVYVSMIFGLDELVCVLDSFCESLSLPERCSVDVPF